MSKLDEMSIGVRVNKTNAPNSSLLGSIERPEPILIPIAKDYYEGKK